MSNTIHDHFCSISMRNCMLMNFAKHRCFETARDTSTTGIFWLQRWTDFGKVKDDNLYSYSSHNYFINVMPWIRFTYNLYNIWISCLSLFSRYPWSTLTICGNLESSLFTFCLEPIVGPGEIWGRTRMLLCRRSIQSIRLHNFKYSNLWIEKCSSLITWFIYS